VDNAVGVEEMQTLDSIAGPLQPLGKGDGAGGGLSEMLSWVGSGHVLEDEAFLSRVPDDLQQPVVLRQLLVDSKLALNVSKTGLLVQLRIDTFPHVPPWQELYQSATPG
jgi:hypothetical protein